MVRATARVKGPGIKGEEYPRRRKRKHIVGQCSRACRAPGLHACLCAPAMACCTCPDPAIWHPACAAPQGAGVGHVFQLHLQAHRRVQVRHHLRRRAEERWPRRCVCGALGTVPTVPWRCGSGRQQLGRMGMGKEGNAVILDDVGPPHNGGSTAWHTGANGWARVMQRCAQTMVGVRCLGGPAPRGHGGQRGGSGVGMNKGASRQGSVRHEWVTSSTC